MCSQWSSKQRIRLNLPISAFYPHFSVLSPFQRFIPISVSVSTIRFQRFFPTPVFCGKLNFVTNCILWQTEFSVVSRQWRMVANIGRSRLILSYLKRSSPQSLIWNKLDNASIVSKSGSFFIFCLGYISDRTSFTVTKIKAYKKNFEQTIWSIMALF